MNVRNFSFGIVEAELTSADVEATINIANSNGISLYNIQHQSNLSISFSVKKSDWKLFESLCINRGDSLKVITKKGAYWSIKHLLSRPVVWIGFVSVILSILFLPTRVLFVRIDGNKTIPDKQIIEAGKRSGIYFGAMRNEVRSEKVKNALLSELPDLKWAGINTRGCVAIISVQERKRLNQQEENEYFNSIVAERDGIITSCTVAEGNLLCSVGDAVQQGELLISGYTDCGFSIRASKAKGEIFAQTKRNLSVIIPADYADKSMLPYEKKKISLLIGKKRINLWKDSGIWDTNCDRMYMEYYVTLPGGYQLPVGIAIESGISYQLTKCKELRTDLENSVIRYGQSYLLQHMVAGNILSRAENFIFLGNTLCMTAEYVCTEMIGKVQREQIGEINGKIN